MEKQDFLALIDLIETIDNDDIQLKQIYQELNQLIPVQGHSKISNALVKKIISHGQKGKPQIKDYEIMYGMIKQLKYILLKQHALIQNSLFNQKEYFHGLQIVDMNDDILDNDLKKLFASKKGKDEIQELNTILLNTSQDNFVQNDARPSSISQPVQFIASQLETTYKTNYRKYYQNQEIQKEKGGKKQVRTKRKRTKTPIMTKKSYLEDNVICPHPQKTPKKQVKKNSQKLKIHTSKTKTNDVKENNGKREFKNIKDLLKRNYKIQFSPSPLIKKTVSQTNYYQQNKFNGKQYTKIDNFTNAQPNVINVEFKSQQIQNPIINQIVQFQKKIHSKSKKETKKQPTSQYNFSQNGQKAYQRAPSPISHIKNQLRFSPIASTKIIGYNKLLKTSQSQVIFKTKIESPRFGTKKKEQNQCIIQDQCSQYQRSLKRAKSQLLNDSKQSSTSSTYSSDHKKQQVKKKIKSKVYSPKKYNQNTFTKSMNDFSFLLSSPNQFISEQIVKEIDERSKSIKPTKKRVKISKTAKVIYTQAKRSKKHNSKINNFIQNQSKLNQQHQKRLGFKKSKSKLKLQDNQANKSIINPKINQRSRSNIFAAKKPNKKDYHCRKVFRNINKKQKVKQIKSQNKTSFINTNKYIDRKSKSVIRQGQDKKKEQKRSLKNCLSQINIGGFQKQGTLQNNIPCFSPIKNKSVISFGGINNTNYFNQQQKKGPTFTSYYQNNLAFKQINSYNNVNTIYGY